jgi:hypothetical protein
VHRRHLWLERNSSTEPIGNTPKWTILKASKTRVGTCKCRKRCHQNCRYSRNSWYGREMTSGSFQLPTANVAFTLPFSYSLSSERRKETDAEVCFRLSSTCWTGDHLSRNLVERRNCRMKQKRIDNHSDWTCYKAYRSPQLEIYETVESVNGEITWYYFTELRKMQRVKPSSKKQFGL